MKTLLVVDYNSLFRRGIELATVSLSWNGIPTNGLYMFVTQLCENIASVQPTHVIVCTDTKPYIRSSLFPQYKLKHKTSDVDVDALKFNYQKVNDLLNLLKIPIWREQGLEADDLIALCVRKYHEQYDQIVIASGDSDLIQLLRYSNIFLRKKVKNKYVLYSRQDFKRLYNLTISQFIDFLCLTGTHNAVPGIRGLGPKKADAIVRNSTLWDETYKQYKEEIDLYRTLIKLPITSNTKTEPLRARAMYSERNVTMLLASAGITMTRKMDDAFRMIGG